MALPDGLADNADAAYRMRDPARTVPQVRANRPWRSDWGQDGIWLMADLGAAYRRSGGIYSCWGLPRVKIKQRTPATARRQ
ncbi:hypothetical protein HCH52_01010 [Oscillospiraceae bacterium HV4-5-C5C]|nr:hypothetical protein [Oscillospiraceae bacterium HV4-5-C5C]